MTPTMPTEGLSEETLELVTQRESDDCTVCAIAMATGLPYERVMDVAAKSVGGYRYQGRPGTMSPKGVLLDLGYEAQRASMTGIGSHTRTRLLWGRRAILSLPSLTGYDGHHDVYWDGRLVRDPSTKTPYPEDALATVEPIFAVVLDELAARAEGPAPPGGGGEEALKEAVIRAARKMPRRTPACGGVGTAHPFEIEAGVVWELDGALTNLDRALTKGADHG